MKACNVSACIFLSVCMCKLRLTGALTDIQNSESKTAFDLANEPETAALLQHAGGFACFINMTNSCRQSRVENLRTDAVSYQ